MCDCITEMDRALAKRGLKLVTSTVCDMEEAVIYAAISVPTKVILVDGKKPRGTKPVGVVVTYCPFCGEKQVPPKRDDPRFKKQPFHAGATNAS